MPETHCPLCHHELDIRDVTPCDVCGANPEELSHLAAGRHTYSEYEIFPELTLVLCDFCDVDFGSYDPVWFGLPKQAKNRIRAHA
ncbi:MAG: hypothetical protein GX776_00855 [Oxalobacter sp.]|nr:hypothetical protein [Oxalobacter sp.]